MDAFEQMRDVCFRLGQLAEELGLPDGSLEIAVKGAVFYELERHVIASPSILTLSRDATSAMRANGAQFEVAGIKVRRQT